NNAAFCAELSDAIRSALLRTTMWTGPPAKKPRVLRWKRLRNSDERPNSCPVQSAFQPASSPAGFHIHQPSTYGHASACDTYHGRCPKAVRSYHALMELTLC